jgi:hypothetical protein
LNTASVFVDSSGKARRQEGWEVGDQGNYAQYEAESGAQIGLRRCGFICAIRLTGTYGDGNFTNTA